MTPHLPDTSKFTCNVFYWFADFCVQFITSKSKTERCLILVCRNSMKVTRNIGVCLRRKLPISHFRAATIHTIEKGDNHKNENAAMLIKANSFLKAIGPVLIAAQCFSLMPVKGIRNSRVSNLKFSWLSGRSIYSCLTILGAFVTAFFCLLHLTHTGLSFATSACTIFSLSTLTSLVLFLKLAAGWPALMVEWQKVEETMSSRYRPIQLKIPFRCLTSSLLLLALVEHLLSNLRYMENAFDCACCTPSSIFHAFLLQSHDYVVNRVGYAHWKGILLCAMGVIKTFCWNFTDLFIVLLSYALADQFVALNERLKNMNGKALPSLFWKTLREDYNLIAELVRRVDSHINKIILLSFASNLYFVCYQLLNSMRPLGNFSEALYFYWSIFYIILKICAVSLSTAKIHDQSLQPKTFLYAVPTQCYSPEVHRFLFQLTTDQVALTGMNFFSVTREFVMKVAGTIVTYEVILMQFNTVADLSAIQAPNTDNITERCLWFSRVYS